MLKIRFSTFKEQLIPVKQMKNVKYDMLGSSKISSTSPLFWLIDDRSSSVQSRAGTVEKMSLDFIICLMSTRDSLKKLAPSLLAWTKWTRFDLTPSPML